MRKIIIVSLISYSIVSCTSKQESLFGTYESILYSYSKRPLEYLAKRNDHRAVGATIILNMDSSFTKTTCANLITGTWKVKNDSLYLIYETNHWKNDNLQKVGFNGKWPSIPNKPYTFFIDGNDLKKTVTRMDSTGKEATTHFDLEKTSFNIK